MRRRLIRPVADAAFLAALLCFAAEVHAQSRLERTHDSRGFHADRNYFSPEPFEHFDTLSGNLILTFTDLTLPGNGGRNLQFQRTFNSRPGEVNGGRYPIAVNRPSWSFGFPGVVMRVIEPVGWPNWPTSSYSFIDNGTCNPDTTGCGDQQNRVWETTPRLITADGAVHRTVYAQTPNASDRTTLQWVRSNNFLDYHRESRILFMPNGMRCRYDERGFLVEMVDQYANRVVLDWQPLLATPTSLTVTQDLQNGQTRVVTMTLDGSGEFPLEMVYDENGRRRVWSHVFTYDPQTLRRTYTFQPPLIPAWVFTSESDTMHVRTPQGGEIMYRWEIRRNDECPPPPGWTGGPIPGKPFNELVERTSTGPAGTQGGTWQIQPVIQPCDLIIRERVIQTPSGTSVRDHYVDNAPGMVYRPPGGEVLNGLLQLGSRTILNGAVELQRQERSYKEVPVVRTGLGVWGTYEVARKIITRGGQTHTTEYTYDEDRPNAFGDYHRPETIREWTNSGPVRTTTLAYVHLSTPFVVGLPFHEQVTVGSESFENTWRYDDTGFLETATLYGTTTTYTRDALGNIGSVRKGSGQPTTFSYSWGQVAAIQTPEHNVERDVRADGTVASETQAGRMTSFQYDDLFRVVRTDPPGGTSAVITNYDDVTGRSVKVSRGPNQSNTSFLITTLDGFGRPIGTENSVGVRTTTRYDAEGRTIYEGYPFVPGAGRGDIGVSITYDALGRVKRRTNPDSTYSEIAYGAGFLTIYDENGRPTTQNFLTFGDPDEHRLASVVDARSQTWTYAYDAIGQLTRVQAPDGSIRTWEYQAGTDRLMRETHPESGTTTYNLYDAAGVLKQKTDANGTVFNYVHDGNGRLLGESTGSSVTSIAYEPGSDNRRLLQTNSSSTELVYDAAGRVSERRDTIDGRMFTTVYEYDNNDNVVAVKYPALQLANRRRVQFEYDSERRIRRVFEGATNYGSGLEYHPSGALTRYTAGNGLVTTLSYDESRYWPQSITAGALGLQYQQYDGVGNVGRIGDSRAGRSQTFTYDALDRLISASSDGGYPVVSWAYDVHGNWQTSGGTTYTYEPGTLRLASQGGIPFTYNNNGNLRTALNATYTYTPRNMLESAAVVGGTTTYRYDAGDMRVKKTTAGANTYFLRGLDQQVLTEWLNPGPSGQIRDYVYAGSRLIAAVKRSTSEDASILWGTITPNGPPVQVTFTTPGQQARLTFEGVAGQRVSVKGTRQSGWYLFYPLAVLSPDGTTLASTSYAYDAFVEPAVLPVDGTYTVLIDPYGSELGTATVWLYDVVDFAGSIAVNGPAASVPLATPGMKARLTFQGTAGQRVSVVGTRQSGSYLFYPLAVLKPDGSTLSSVSYAYDVFLEPLTLPDTGVYTVLVDPTGAETGAITIALYAVTDVTGTITIGGSAVTVPLPTPGQKAHLTFAAAAGQRVSAVGTRQSGWYLFYPLAVLRPDGTTLGSINSAYDVFLEPLTIPAAGIYTLLIDPSGKETGTATVSVHDVVDITGSITIGGSSVTVTMATPGQKARLAMAGTSGQTVTVRLTGNSIGYTTVTLLKPDGSQVTSTTQWLSSFNLSTVTLQANGNYTILLDPSAASIGTITVAVTTP